MAIARMKRIEVIGHLDCKDDTLRTLQNLGAVEIEDITSALEEREESSGDGLADLKQIVNRDNESDRLTALEEEIGRVRSSLDFIERFCPSERTFIEQFTGSQVPVSRQELEEFVSDQDSFSKTIALVGELEQRYLQLVDRENDLSVSIEQIKPWEQLGVPIEMLVSTRNTVVHAGSVDSGTIDELSEVLTQASRGAAVLTVVSQDENSTRLVVVTHREYDSDVLSALRTYNFTAQSFPFENGRVADFLAGAREELSQTRSEVNEVAERVRSLKSEKVRLSAVLDRMEAERDRLQISERLLRTQKAFGLAGWIREDDCDKVSEALVQIDEALILDVRDPDPGEEPPVALTNSRLSRPFEVVLELYSMPRRYEIDPTVFVSFFFALFFAMAVADAGYGIALAGLCYVLLRTVRMSELGRKTFELFLIAGIATVVVGLATGGFFGLTLRFALINPIEQPILFLLISFAVGIVHVYAGMMIKLFENLRKGKVIAGLLDQGLWFVLLTSLLVLAVQSQASFDVPYASYAGYAAAASAIGLIATQGRHQRNPLLKLGSGLASLYDIFSYLSDILSYSRLLGLGMASGVIASVINLVAGMFWSTPVVGPIVTIAILLGGHAFNLFIGVIGAYVHVSRLHYVEFFSKFFEGGGRAFSPFKVNSRYVYVKEAEQQGGNV